MSIAEISEGIEASPEWQHYRCCDLCPHACGVDRTHGERGMCGAATQLRLGRAALHWWEEPCLVGNQGSGAVFFSYCTLRCIYCQNYELAHGQGVNVPFERLPEIFLELQNTHHAANINLVTPGQFLPHVVLALQQASDALTIPVVYNTSGYESLQGLSLARGLVDVYLSDFKYTTCDCAQELSHARTYPQAARAALREMVNQVGTPVFDATTGLLKKGVIVRHLVLPGRLEESRKVLQLLHSEFGNDVLLSIMSQYTPMGNSRQQKALAKEGLDEPLAKQDYERVLDYADALGFDDYFWQDGQSCGESFIPSFDGQGVMA